MARSMAKSMAKKEVRLTTYSIAEAKNLLGRIVHEAEAGEKVEITRRGKPVAVLLSTAEAARLQERPPDFWSSYQRFRAAHDLAALDIDPSEVFAAEKDPSPGRDFAW